MFRLKEQITISFGTESLKNKALTFPGAVFPGLFSSYKL